MRKKLPKIDGQIDTYTERMKCNPLRLYSYLYDLTQPPQAGTNTRISLVWRRQWRPLQTLLLHSRCCCMRYYHYYCYSFRIVHCFYFCAWHAFNVRCFSLNYAIWNSTRNAGSSSLEHMHTYKRTNTHAHIDAQAKAQVHRLWLCLSNIGTSTSNKKVVIWKNRYRDNELEMKWEGKKSKK